MCQNILTKNYKNNRKIKNILIFLKHQLILFFFFQNATHDVLQMLFIKNGDFVHWNIGYSKYMIKKINFLSYLIKKKKFFIETHLFDFY